MRTEYHHHPPGPAKTLGTTAARLVAALHERDRILFSIRDVRQITGLAAPSAHSLTAKLVLRGVVTRLKPGLFILVPIELGHGRQYFGNPYVIARELAGGRSYYLSHASAMEIHGMLTQPRFVVYVSTSRRLRPQNILGTEFRFVYTKRAALFGALEHWVDKQQRVLVSDGERTIIDGLRQPEYCGGVTEVAKGLWIRRADLDPKRLVDYALRLHRGAVMRRLGYLMETFQIGPPRQCERLRKELTPTYSLLDPILPGEGRFLSRWRLRLNVSLEELRGAAAT